jgi:outer membrane protein assembly factor BamB
MTYMPILRRSLLGAVLILFSSGVFAADWPQWRGPFRTGHVAADVPVPSTLPAEPKVIWHIPVGDGFASPVVSGGRVFYLDNQDAQEVAHALDAQTGKELWRAQIFSSHRDGFGIGPRCTPVVDGAQLFVQSAKGEFQCLDAQHGKKVMWRTNFVDDFGAMYTGEKGKAAGASRHGAAGSPLVGPDRVIAQVGSAKGASIVTFTKIYGNVIWKSQNDQTAYAAPIVATLGGEEQVVAFTAEALIGLRLSDGTLRWRRPLQTALGRHVTTPVAIGNLIVVGSHQIGLTGTLIERAGENFTASEAWTNKAAAMNFTSPVEVRGAIFGIGPAKNLLCVDAKDGQVLWEKAGLIQTSADRAEAAFIVMGDNILMLTDSGLLVLFAADASTYRELGRAQVCGQNWCNPAYVDGRLFLRDARELSCIELLP